MGQSELVQEAMNGLQDYRNALVDGYATAESSVNVSEVRRLLADEGIVSYSPVLTIPYELEDLDRVVVLNARHRWTEPHTVIRLQEAFEKRQGRAAGKSVEDVSFPTPFWVPLLDVVVVVDDTKINSLDFGEPFAMGNTLDMRAHEMTHGAFALLTTMYPSQVDDSVEIQQIYSIGQAEDIKTLRPFSAQEPEYEPMWLDEAFAGYMAAEVRSKLIPEASPDESAWITDNMCDVSVEVPAKYLLKIDSSSSHYALAISEGVGFDNLVKKRPDLLPQIKALSTGRLAIQDFHTDLRNSLGSTLYSDVVERRPYSSWGDTLHQIEEL